MIAIPGGKFLMGSPKGKGVEDECPQHEVIVSAFWIGKYEVTSAQWKAVMGRVNGPGYSGDWPVAEVSWNEAEQFCKVLSGRMGKNYRLLYEAEWEYACRAGTTTQFSFGDSEQLYNEYAWVGGRYGRSSIPVGTKKPNNWGLHDMHGNLYEWCRDWYNENYYCLNLGGSKPSPLGDGFSTSA